ncbi:DNA repair protein Rad51 homolog [Drosophila virilis]|uniref:RecA family profile 1 domain-containing protein n=1 Tax=Drosophila virilis TaxID=7244 RepID=B4ME51_DROVI|nr:uncharacterized protein LOC6635975 [Drosophila virilis]EDW58816.1 uncharacterized protein Dvir_GJ17534 [Drosophila virilis]
MEDKRELRSLLLATKTGKQLSEYHIKLLQKQNISTAEEFIDADNVHTILALASDTTEEIKRELLNLYVGRIKFKTLYQSQPINYSTGIEDLDKLLDSIGQPFRPGRVWELIGDNDVGKTELLHTLAVNFVCKYGEQQQVLFVDTNLDFDSERLEEILLERKQLSEAAIDRSLDAINVVQATTAESLIAALAALLEKLASPNAKFEAVSRIKVVLIDSLTACYILYRSSYGRNKGRRFLTELAMIIRKLAVQHGIAFIIGNMTFSPDDETNDMGEDEDVDNEGGSTQKSTDAQEDCSFLGDYWCSVCTLTLVLELPDESHCDGDGLRLLKVLNNNFGISDGSCLLRITDAGVI